MNLIKNKNIYISLIIIVGLTSGLLLLDLINPRKSETVNIRITGIDINLLNQIRIMRLNYHNEEIVIPRDEIVDDSVGNWISANNFVQGLLLKLPVNSKNHFNNILISIGEKKFCFNENQILSEWEPIESENIKYISYNTFKFPDYVKNEEIEIQPFSSIINLTKINLSKYLLISLSLVILFWVLCHVIRKYRIQIYGIQDLLNHNFSFKTGNNPLIIIIGVSLIATTIITFLSIHLVNIYYENYPYFLDPVKNNLDFVNIYEELENYSTIGVIVNQLNTNVINPIRSIPLIIFAPKLLIHPYGHIIHTILFLYIFLIFLGYFIYNQIHSISIAITVIIFFISAPVLIHPHYGLIPFWQDLSAGFPLGTAGISLLLWDQLKKIKWLVLFSIFLSIAILSRYNVSFYAFILYAPVIIFYLIRNWIKGKCFGESVIKPLLLIVSIVGLLCGYWVIKHFSANLNYYANSDSFGNTGFGIIPSIIGLVTRSVIYFGPFFIILMGCIIIFYNVVFIKSMKKEYSYYLITHWLIFAVPLYWVFFLGLDLMKLGVVGLVVYPLCLFPIFYQTPTIGFEINKIYKISFLIIVLISSLFIIGYNYFCLLDYSKKPIYNNLKDEKKIQQEIARIINSLEKHEKMRPIQYLNFVGDSKINYNYELETYYKTGILLNLSHLQFSTEKFCGKNNQNEFAIEKEGNLIYDSLNIHINFVLVFKDLDFYDKIDFCGGSVSKKLSKYITSRIKHDGNWEKISVINTNKYSKIEIYKKRKIDTI